MTIALAADQSLNNAFCWGGCGERSCSKKAATSHSVAVDQTPNLLLGRWTLYH